MKNVTVIGAAIVDVMVSPADELAFRTGSHPAERILISHGGDALNEATVLHRLGVPVRLETLIGDDAAGDSVLRRMEAVGLPTDGVHVRPGLATSVNLVLVKPDGERSFITVPTASQRALRLSDIEVPNDTDILCLASIFVFPEIKTPELAGLFSRARATGITVCADMTKRKNGETLADMAPALKYVDYLFPNAEEAMLLTGENSPEAAAEALFAAGVGCVIVKLGAGGCYVRRAGGGFSFPAAAAERCVDTTGAGDSFAAGFMSGLAADEPLESCLRRACFCGARAVEHLGATAWTEAGAAMPF